MQHSKDANLDEGTMKYNCTCTFFALRAFPRNLILFVVVHLSWDWDTPLMVPDVALITANHPLSSWHSTFAVNIECDFEECSLLNVANSARNGLSSLLLKQEWWWFLISFYTYSLVTGSTPAHKSYAIATANNPQSLLPFWWPTFTTLIDMVGLGVCRIVHTCVNIVPSSTGTVCIESNKSTFPRDEKLFDRQAQWSQDTCIIWTNLSGVDDQLPRCFSIHVSCRPFWVGNWDLNRQLAGNMCCCQPFFIYKCLFASDWQPKIIDPGTKFRGLR